MFCIPVRGDIEAFCGKARLLVTSKLKKQYQRMIDDALSPTYTPPTKVSDLTGFWEMVQLQVGSDAWVHVRKQREICKYFHLAINLVL